MLEDLLAGRAHGRRSVSADPDWHAAWLADVTKGNATRAIILQSREPQGSRIIGLTI